MRNPLLALGMWLLVLGLLGWAATVGAQGDSTPEPVIGEPACWPETLCQPQTPEPVIGDPACEPCAICGQCTPEPQWAGGDWVMPTGTPTMTPTVTPTRAPGLVHRGRPWWWVRWVTRE